MQLRWFELITSHIHKIENIEVNRGRVQNRMCQEVVQILALYGTWRKLLILAYLALVELTQFESLD